MNSSPKFASSTLSNEDDIQNAVESLWSFSFTISASGRSLELFDVSVSESVIGTSCVWFQEHIREKVPHPTIYAKLGFYTNKMLPLLLLLFCFFYKCSIVQINPCIMLHQTSLIKSLSLRFRFEALGSGRQGAAAEAQSFAILNDSLYKLSSSIFCFRRRLRRL